MDSEVLVFKPERKELDLNPHVHQVLDMHSQAADAGSCWFALQSRNATARSDVQPKKNTPRQLFREWRAWFAELPQTRTPNNQMSVELHTYIYIYI